MQRGGGGGCRSNGGLGYLLIEGNVVVVSVVHPEWLCPDSNAIFQVIPDPPGASRYTINQRFGGSDLELKQCKDVPYRHSFFACTILHLVWISFSAYYFLKIHLHHFSKIKSHKKGFSWYYFCLMIEGSGSIPGTLINGSGSGPRRPKNILIRIRNTCLYLDRVYNVRYRYLSTVGMVLSFVGNTVIVFAFCCRVMLKKASHPQPMIFLRG
jgi:hypothetical protein